MLWFQDGSATANLQSLEDKKLPAFYVLVSVT